MRALVDERDAIDRRVADLRTHKASMPDAQYEAEMEKLLTELAVKTREIRELQARKK
jgi:hypothetical protein